MPWRQVDPMSERHRFILDARRRIASFTERCTHYGISRKTGYSGCIGPRPTGAPAWASSRAAPAPARTRRPSAWWCGCSRPAADTHAGGPGSS